MVMTEVMEPGRSVRLTLAPNRSLTWEGNLWVLISLLVLSLFTSIGFLLMGAWVIMPFVGVELALLAFALFYVQQRTQVREVIYIDERRIKIEKGFGAPQVSWSFCRPRVSVMVESGGEFSGTQHICFCGDQGMITVGEFLNPSDRALLVEDLSGRGLRTRCHRDWSTLAV